jgi:hypothetical protein
MAVDAHKIAFAARIVFLGTFAVSTVIAVFEDRKEMKTRFFDRVTWRPPPPENLVFGETTVKDTLTGLEWSREPAPIRLRWNEAKAYCDSLATDGGGWRLPSRDELMSVLHFNNDPFGAELDWYWSTTVGVRAGTAWAVGEGAWLNGNPIETQSRVRCVRSPK